MPWMGAASVASALYALAQVSLGEPPSALMVIPVAAALGLLTYASSFIGQGLALAQMYELRRLLEESVERAEQQTRRRDHRPSDS